MIAAEPPVLPPREARGARWRTERRWGGGLAAGALLVVLALLLAACGPRRNQTARPRPTPTAPGPTTPGPTTNPEAGAVLAAYRTFWQVYQEASNPMNPTDPRLAASATGEELRKVSTAFLARKAAGEVFKGRIELAPQIIEVGPDRAVISDCSLDGLGIYDAASGALKQPPDTRRALETVTMLKIGGIWKLASVRLERYGCTPAP